jgi:hypothetical protein
MPIKALVKTCMDPAGITILTKAVKARIKPNKACFETF